MSQPLPQIDLKSCTPDSLASWLYENRFDKNAMDVASFLLNCTATLPNAEEISAKLLGGGGSDDEDEEVEGETDDQNKEETTDPQTQMLHNILESPPISVSNSNKDANDESSQNAMEIEVSCTTPRGKFLLSLHEKGMVLTNPKKREEERIPILSTCVENVIWFRKPEDYKKVKQMKSSSGSGKGGANKCIPGHMVLISLNANHSGGSDDGGSHPIMFRNKELTQLCLQLPSYPVSSSSEGGCEENKQFKEEQWWKALKASLISGGNGKLVRVSSTIDHASYLKSGDDFAFQSAEGEGTSGSSTTTAGMPFVGCYHGINDGVLFPLKEGLLFFKPPLFVHRSTLTSISCGRGSGGSRYVDMIVQLDPSSDTKAKVDSSDGKKKKQSLKESLEFTNIHRDELSVLNDYIHNTLIPAMEADAGEVRQTDEGEEEADSVVAEVVATSDDEESGDNGSKEETASSAGKRRRSSRAASKMAREATRAHYSSPGRQVSTEEDDDDEDEDGEFRTGEYDTDGSDDGDDEVVTDEESENDEDESSDEEEFDEEGMSGESDEDEDSDDECEKNNPEKMRAKKKARVA